MSTERHIRFGFDGGRSGTGGATWGQRAIWDAVGALGPDDAARYTLRGGGAVEPVYPVAAVLPVLGELVLRHESLRTRLSLADDGGLRQTVSGSGELVATVVESAEEDAEGVAAALSERLAERPFDSAAEWPIRVGIVESGGFVRQTIFAVAHTAVDGWGLRNMVLDLTALATGTAVTDGGAGPRQPLEEAEYQSSAQGRRQDSAARRHWCEKVASGPHQLLAPKADPDRAGDGDGAPLFPNALLDSPALGRAVPLLAEHLAVSPAAVLLASTAVMTTRLGGSPEALFQVVVNNRFRPGLEWAVNTIAQEGLFHLPVADVPFSELVRSAFRASVAAYRHAYYDKASLGRDLAELRSAQPETADLTCFINDTRGLAPIFGAAGADDAARSGLADTPLDKLRSHSTLTWPRHFPPRRGVSFALDAVNLPGSTGLTMTADPARLPRPEMERFLVGIEDLVVEEALRIAEL